MINYTIAEFLGLFLIGFPVFLFLTILLFWGLRQLLNRFFEEDFLGEKREEDFLGERKRRFKT